MQFMRSPKLCTETGDFSDSCLWGAAGVGVYVIWAAEVPGGQPPSMGESTRGGRRLRRTSWASFSFSSCFPSPPARVLARTVTPAPTRLLHTWLPMKPEAPVTSTRRGMAGWREWGPRGNGRRQGGQTLVVARRDQTDDHGADEGRAFSCPILVRCLDSANHRCVP